MDDVLGVPVKYLEHYSMFSALSGLWPVCSLEQTGSSEQQAAQRDVFVHPEDDEFTFPDGEVFPCKLLDQALFEYHAVLGRDWLEMQAKYDSFGEYFEK